jgi:1-acyl-sn-glycerol-3-phosphate acyltransferase
LFVTRLHKPKAGFYIRLVVVVLYPLTSAMFRLRWRGLQNVPPPEAGGVIVAINHTSHVDTILMARTLWQSGRIPRFMVKDGVFKKPVLGRLFYNTKQIPVHRGTANAANALTDAVAALEAGEAVVIYPEGSITRDPEQWPMQGKTGIARLVLSCPNIPVLPIGQWGAQQRRPGQKRTLTRRTSTVIVGKPMDLSQFAGAEPNATVLREITDTVMNEIRDLVAQARSTEAD